MIWFYVYAKQKNEWSLNLFTSCVHARWNFFIGCINVTVRTLLMFIFFSAWSWSVWVSEDCRNIRHWDQALGCRERGKFACTAVNITICAFISFLNSLFLIILNLQFFGLSIISDAFLTLRVCNPFNTKSHSILQGTSTC